MKERMSEQMSGVGRPAARDPHAPATPAERRAVVRSYWGAYLWRKALASAAAVGGALWAERGGLSLAGALALSLGAVALLEVVVAGVLVAGDRAAGARAPAEHPKVTAARALLRRGVGGLALACALSAALLGRLVAELREEVGRAESARDLSFTAGAPSALVDTLAVSQDLMFESRQSLAPAGAWGPRAVEVVVTAAVSVKGKRADQRPVFLTGGARQRLKRAALLSPEELQRQVGRLLERARKELAGRPALKGQCFSLADPALEREHRALLLRARALSEGAPALFVRREPIQQCVKQAGGALFLYFALTLSIEIALLLGLMKLRLAIDAARRLHPAPLA